VYCFPRVFFVHLRSSMSHWAIYLDFCPGKSYDVWVSGLIHCPDKSRLANVMIPSYGLTMTFERKKQSCSVGVCDMVLKKYIYTPIPVIQIPRIPMSYVSAIFLQDRSQSRWSAIPMSWPAITITWSVVPVSWPLFILVHCLSNEWMEEWKDSGCTLGKIIKRIKLSM